jgi:hypothetical protein
MSTPVDTRLIEALKSDLACSLASEQRSQQALNERELIIEEQRRELQAGREALSELLAAVQEVVAISDRKHDAWDRAKAAIAKATGEQP